MAGGTARGLKKRARNHKWTTRVYPPLSAGFRRRWDGCRPPEDARWPAVQVCTGAPAGGGLMAGRRAGFFFHVQREQGGSGEGALFGSAHFVIKAKFGLYKKLSGNCKMAQIQGSFRKSAISRPFECKFRKVFNTKVVRLGKTSPTEVESRQSEFV